MSGWPVSSGAHPPHGHPDNTAPSTQPTDKPSTASHPPSTKPDPTSTSNQNAHHESQRGQSTSHPSTPAKLASLQMKLRSALRQFPDWPTPGVLFEDVMPIFADPKLHADLIDALELHILSTFGEHRKPDVLVALEARGFLFAPTLALRLGASFVPVRKKGKLPGKTETAAYKKEYGEDLFEIQTESIKQGQKVVIVDDLIATGGSAAAAGELVRKAGGALLEYMFLIELDFLKGREKLDAPIYALLSSQ
ncbi:MAG: hypothetical protein Q9159_006759 [Coniocarpon cinnabarinum]